MMEFLSSQRRSSQPNGLIYVSVLVLLDYKKYISQGLFCPFFNSKNCCVRLSTSREKISHILSNKWWQYTSSSSVNTRSEEPQSDCFSKVALLFLNALLNTIILCYEAAK